MADTTLPLLPDLLCFSHLRWEFVFQRPQHIMSRFARERRVFYFEEPVRDAAEPRLELEETEAGVRLAVPHLPASYDEDQSEAALRCMVDELIQGEEVQRFVN